MKILFVLFAAALFETAYAQDSIRPEPAFPGFVDFLNVRDLALSSDQSEAYFTVQSPNEEIAAIVKIEARNGMWLVPELVPFTGMYRDIEPFLSPDGLRLYFSSNRPLNGLGGPAKDYDIWYVERKSAAEQWLAPVNLGKPVNTAANEFYPSLAANGNLYFTSDAATLVNKDDIYFAEWKKEKYDTPVALGSTINSLNYEFNAYVSPDESMLIYTAYGRKESFGSGDLYISYRNEKGNWSQAENMGPAINSNAMDYCPFLDLKTGTLYFTSKRSSVVSRGFTSIKGFVQSANQYENGLSRLYKIKFLPK